MKKISIIALGVLLSGLIPVFAQDVKFTALLIVNFAKYVGWPVDSQKGDFVITVLGDDPVVEELQAAGQNTAIGDQKIVVKKALSLDRVERCNILYISPDKSNSLTSALGKFPASTLVVTNKDGLAKEGSGINIVMIDGKMRFEINVESLKKSGLTAKPVLFKLGKSV
jgi:hypothetical protein